MENNFDDNTNNKRIDKKDIFSKSWIDGRFGKFDEKDKIDYYKSFRWSYLVTVALSFIFFIIEDNYAFLLIAFACAASKCIYDAIVKKTALNIASAIVFLFATILFMFKYLLNKGLF